MKQNYFRKAFNAKKLKIFIALFLSVNMAAIPFAYADDETEDAVKAAAEGVAEGKVAEYATDEVKKAIGDEASKNIGNIGNYAGAVQAIANGDVSGVAEQAVNEYLASEAAKEAASEALKNGTSVKASSPMEVVGDMASSTLLGKFGGFPILGTKTVRYTYTSPTKVAWICAGKGEFSENNTANEEYLYTCYATRVGPAGPADPACKPYFPFVHIQGIQPNGGAFSKSSPAVPYICTYAHSVRVGTSTITIHGNTYQGQTSIGDGSDDLFSNDAEYSSALQQWEKEGEYNWGDWGNGFEYTDPNFEYSDKNFEYSLNDAVVAFQNSGISYTGEYDGIDAWNAENGDFSWNGNSNADPDSVINDIYRDGSGDSYNAGGGWADSADWSGSSGNLDDYFGNDIYDPTPSNASGMTDDLIGFDNNGNNGYYDADGNWHNVGTLDDGYYDANGNWISKEGSYDADGRYTPNGTHYDENGNLVSDGGYYDENGNWVSVNGSYDAEGRFVPDGMHYDENGNLVPDGGYYDADGNWVSTDGQGGYYDENGNWITTNGGVEGYYDANGHFVATGGSDLGLDYADRDQKEAYSDDDVLSWDNIKNSFLRSLGAGGDGNSSFFGNGKDGGASSLSNFLSNVLGGKDGSVFGKAEPLSNQEMASLAKKFLSAGGYSVDELKKGENYDRNSAYTEPEKSWDMNRITKLLKSGDVSLDNEQADKQAEKNSLVGAAQKGQAWIPKD